ncbi:MAG: disulfide bond formation protein B [Caulobacteraceae bacterium]
MTPLAALLKRWPLAALVISAAMLAVAHGFQSFGHLEPCHMCLIQREAYWTAIGVAVVALLASPALRAWPVGRVASLVLAGVFAWGLAVAVWQAGAEWKWWSAPASCASAGAGGVSLSALKALMAGAASAPPACDKAAWVFLGLSMAGWNAVVSAILAGLSLAAAARPEKPA